MRLLLGQRKTGGGAGRRAGSERKLKEEKERRETGEGEKSAGFLQDGEFYSLRLCCFVIFPNFYCFK